MGKRNKKTKRKINTGNRSQKDEGTSRRAKFTADQLLDKVDEFMDRFEFDFAKQFCQRALETEADNIRALETMGTIHLELGDLEAAKLCFLRSVELEPETGYSKYMYLGQLQTSEEAVKAFLKGIQLMKQCREKSQKTRSDSGACASTEANITARDISSAHCAVAEIYLTDECFEDSAEERCKENIDHALTADNSNPEAHHLLASYQLSKDCTKLAREAIEKGVSLWLPQMKEASQTEAAAADPVSVCDVSYPARVNAAKILIEVGNYELASEVLELLLDEEDEVVEVWYLLGWLNYLQGEDYKVNARFYLSKAKDVNKKVGCEDEQIVQHIGELLDELGPGDAADAADEEDATAEDDEEDADEMDVDDADVGDQNDDSRTSDTKCNTDSKSDGMEH